MKQISLREYFVPSGLQEALRILDEYQGSLGVIAGGTDVFVDEHHDLDAMLDITKTGLDYIRLDGDTLCIGSCTTYRDLIRSQDIKNNLPCLLEASNVIADMTIRNIATVGGNICSAVPSGDAIPPMIAADADFVLASKQGERTVKAVDFFKGPRKTELKKNEIIKEFRIALPKEKFSSSFEKIARNSVDLANANVAVFISCSKDGLISDIKIALGAVAATVVRAKDVESALVGKKPDEALVKEACACINKAISPITNIRSTKEYRSEVLSALVRNAVMRAYNAAAADRRIFIRKQGG